MISSEYLARSDKLILRNEFAHVEVTVDSLANGPRLKITDYQSGNICFLDPLQVECLTRANPDLLDSFLPYEFGPELTDERSRSPFLDEEMERP